MAFGMSGSGGHSGKISEGAMAEVWGALGRYRVELAAAGLPRTTSILRYQQAMLFARWLDGHYEFVVGRKSEDSG